MNYKNKIKKIIREEINILFEKSHSKAQQRFFGMVKNCKENPKNCDKYGKNVKKTAKNMKKSDIDDFAKTKHKKLPDHLEEESKNNQNPLNGMTNEKARRYIYKILNGKYKTGIYKDQYWQGKQDILKALNDANIEYVIDNNYYFNWPPKELMKPSGKKWKLSIPFKNNRSIHTILHGTITASGAGNIDDPLNFYDINFTVF